MNGAAVAFAISIALIAMAGLILVVVYLLRERHQSDALVAALNDTHARERQELVRAVIARHSGEIVQMQRAEQAPYLARLEAEAIAGIHPANDGWVDEETHEHMVPVGFEQ